LERELFEFVFELLDLEPLDLELLSLFEELRDDLLFSCFCGVEFSVFSV